MADVSGTCPDHPNAPLVSQESTEKGIIERCSICNKEIAKVEEPDYRSQGLTGQAPDYEQSHDPEPASEETATPDAETTDKEE